MDSLEAASAHLNASSGPKSPVAKVARRDPPEGFIRVRPSKFAGIPSTVFFDYPEDLRMKRSDYSELEEQGKRKMRYETHWERNCIKNAFHRAGYTRSEKNWTALWSKHQTEEFTKQLNCLQKVNHFPSSWCIGRKDRLMQTITMMRRVHGSEYDFHPEGFILPQEREALLRQITAVDASSSSKLVRKLS